jgi:hypothetical protein
MVRKATYMYVYIYTPISFLQKYIIIILYYNCLSKKLKLVCSAIKLRKVTESVGEEILYNLTSFKIMLKNVPLATLYYLNVNNY